MDSLGYIESLPLSDTNVAKHSTHMHIQYTNLKLREMGGGGGGGFQQYPEPVIYHAARYITEQTCFNSWCPINWPAMAVSLAPASLRHLT